MNTWQNKFDYIKFFGRMISVSVLCAVMGVGGAFAANDGCDKEENDRITAELALCSTHAYNIGHTTNPEGTDQELMKEIIALKTTVIAQQMEKQYEYMDAMLRRFKTQLEKAVLTTKIQTAKGTGEVSDNGGGSSYSGGGYSDNSGTNTRKDGLEEADNCGEKWNVSDIFACLQDNVIKMTNALQSNQSGVRRQIKKDAEQLCNNLQTGVTCEGMCDTNKKVTGECSNPSSSSKVNTCLGKMRSCIIKNQEAIKDTEARRTNPYYNNR